MSIQEKAIKGVAWTTLDQLGGQIMALLVFLILARLLDPKAFGLVAICMAFIAVMEIFQKFGFTHAIVQRNDLEKGHLDTAFWINIGAGLLLFLIGWAGAGVFAEFYREPLLKPIIRWLSFTFLVHSLCNVQIAILKRDMAFRSLAARSLLSRFAGGVTGVTLALNGFGVWSLVAQQLVSGSVRVLVLWAVSDWRPGFEVTKRHFKDLFSFGASLMASQALYVLSIRMDDFLIGYYLGPTALGYYTIAFRLIKMGTALLAGTVQKVSFPLFSRLQNDRNELQTTYYHATRITSIVAFPGFFALIVLAPEVIPVFFGDKWVDSVPVMQVLSIMGVVTALMGFKVAMLLSQGKPFWSLVIQAVETVIMVVGFMIAVSWGIMAVAVARVFAGLVMTPVWFRAVKKVSGISGVTYLNNFREPFLASCAMIATIVGVRSSLSTSWAPLVELLIYGSIGGVVYLGVLHLLAPNLLNEAMVLFKQLKANKKKIKKAKK